MYNPMYLQNYQSGYTPNYLQSQQLIKVSGFDGAKSYQTSPNSVVPLFDSDNDIMYIKSTDGNGFSNIRSFSFQAIETNSNPDYVTRAELVQAIDELKEMIPHAKQPVSKPKQ